jgi:hypothetical protein
MSIDEFCKEIDEATKTTPYQSSLAVVPPTQHEVVPEVHSLPGPPESHASIERYKYNSSSLFSILTIIL